MVVEVPAEGRHNIVRLASYPKSGNTWVRVFLHDLIRVMQGESGAQDQYPRTVYRLGINLGRLLKCGRKLVAYRQKYSDSSRCSANRS
jgi:hypothetical protein